MKKESGYVIVVVLSVLFFLSLLSLSAFYVGNNDRKISYNVILQNKLFSAAENSIQYSIYEMGLGSNILLEVLDLNGTQEVNHCLTETEFKKSTCSNDTFTSDKVFKSFSKITLLNKECLSYGNTDQSVFCYSVEGTGELSVYPYSFNSNVQEVKIKVININNNGVYEF